MYVFVCDACKTGSHKDCEVNRDVPPVAEDPFDQILGGGSCVCPHDGIYQTPDQVWSR